MPGKDNNFSTRLSRIKWTMVILTIAVSMLIMLIIYLFHREYLVMKDELIVKIDALHKIESQIVRLRTHAIYITLEDDKKRFFVHKKRSQKSFNELMIAFERFNSLPRKAEEDIFFEDDKRLINETWRLQQIVIQNATFYDETTTKDFLRWQFIPQSADAVKAIEAHISYLNRELKDRQRKLEYLIEIFFFVAIAAMFVRIFITIRHSQVMEREIRVSAEIIKNALVKVKKEYDLGVKVPVIDNEFGLVANEINQLINYFRKNYTVFDKNIREDVVAINAELANAIASNELFLLYQPIVEASTGKVCKVEALLRWNNAKFGPISPDRFIPIAEQYGLISDIEDWVIKTALAQQKRWRDESGLDLIVAINVTSPHFLSEGFSDFMKREINAAGCNPTQVELEVTESVMISDTNSGVLTLQALSDFGVRTSLDDFGTGYSSLSYLARFKFHALKIDRSFFSSADIDEDTFKLVDGVISIGHALSMQIIAEGVENITQLRKLREMGCDYVQGFYFSKPIAPTEIPNLIADSRNKLILLGAN